MTTSASKILCVEDSPEYQLLVGQSLKNYDVTYASTLKDATEQLATNKYDLILLDLSLPDGDGISLFSDISAKTDGSSHFFPVIVLSAFDSISNKVAAFSLGAEDFISKPFDLVELRVRVDAKIKKISVLREKSNFMKIGNLEIDSERHQVFVVSPAGKEALSLTNLEYRILQILGKKPDRIFSREMLLNMAWGDTRHVTDRSVDVYISYLRKKLKSSNVSIETVTGSGYRLKLSDPV